MAEVVLSTQNGNVSLYRREKRGLTLGCVLPPSGGLGYNARLLYKDYYKQC